MVTLLPVVKSFLARTPVPMYINGAWCEADSGATIDVRDPGSARVIAKIPAGGEREADLAVRAAKTAFRTSGWATMPANDRAAGLHRLADLVDKHREELVQLESLDVGKPLAQAACFDIPNVAQTLRYYADLSVHTRRREPLAVPRFEAATVRKPYGVCAFVLPWNFPLLLVGWAIAPALAAGNTVVIKPAEDTPLSTLFFCTLAEEAGLPHGVLNVVTGTGESAGAALVAHPDVNRVGFTGSPEIGRMIAQTCGKNLVPVKLELGGKGAAVVFDDVDIEATAQALVAAITLNSGQVCCTATRWIVQKRIFDRLVERAADALQGIRIGHGSDPKTEMGPVVSAKQRQRVLNYLARGEQQGAVALLRGGTASVPGNGDGFYVKPALLTGPAENVCAREEIFGPVAYVMPFSNEAEAIDLVNASRYGLANSVWTQDLIRAQRVAEALDAGNSWINAHNLFAHGIPYAGCNLSGIGGGVLGPETLLDYLRPQSIVRPLS